MTGTAAALFERDVAHYARYFTPSGLTDWHEVRARMPLNDFGNAPDIERLTAWTLPSARAAVVLSAVGVPLAGGAA